MTCSDNFGESIYVCTVADAYRELRPGMRFDEAGGCWCFTEPVTREELVGRKQEMEAQAEEAAAERGRADVKPQDGGASAWRSPK